MIPKEVMFIIILGIWVFGFICSIVISGVYTSFRQVKMRNVIIEDEAEIRHIISEYKDICLKIHPILNLDKNYIEVTYRTKYKKSRNTDWEKVSEKIVAVNYYVNC